MNARNQLLAVLTALMLVTTGWAMVATAGAVSGMSDDEADTGLDDGETEEPAPERTANETANETTDGATTDGATTDGATTDNATTDNTTTDEAAEPVADGEAAQVTFENQATDGQTVVIDSVTMDEGGFVAIHNSSLLVGNAVGSVVGVSEYLEPGTHENVTVTLDEPLAADETLIAMPHLDTNGNQVYDFVETEGQEDGPYLTPEGEPVTDDAVVTLDAGADADAEVGNESEQVGNESEQVVDENESAEAVVEEENETGVDDAIEENETIAEEDEEPIVDEGDEDLETDEPDVETEEPDDAPQSIDVTVEQAQVLVLVVDGDEFADVDETETDDAEMDDVETDDAETDDADTDDVEENETETDDLEDETDDGDTNGDETDTDATVIESEDGDADDEESEADDADDEATDTDDDNNGSGTVIEEN